MKPSLPQSLLLNQIFVGSLYLHDDTQTYYSSLQLQLQLKFDVKQTTKIKCPFKRNVLSFSIFSIF